MDEVNGTNAGVNEPGKTELHRIVRLALRGEYQDPVVKRPGFATMVGQIANELPAEIKGILLAKGARCGEQMSTIERFLRSEQVRGILNSTPLGTEVDRWGFFAGAKSVGTKNTNPKVEQLAA